MQPATSTPVSPRKLPGWLRLFEPSPAAAVILTEPAAIRETYRRWRWRILISTIIGYATFYFVRKNLGVAMPLMEKELGISKSGLGLFLTLHGDPEIFAHEIKRGVANNRRDQN